MFQPSPNKYGSRFTKHTDPSRRGPIENSCMRKNPEATSGGSPRERKHLGNSYRRGKRLAIGYTIDWQTPNLLQPCTTAKKSGNNNSVPRHSINMCSILLVHATYPGRPPKYRQPYTSDMASAKGRGDWVCGSGREFP
ncbi:unnamed protein product [Tuber aestivum]|uniref:Uncharacterized protein n=1 Tax=Tuber aestivum TaxID=59557 RepID=A0A292PNB3_9PEZI|nr:unnamed protein product [Tuber aestivum]